MELKEEKGFLIIYIMGILFLIEILILSYVTILRISHFSINKDKLKEELKILSTLTCSDKLCLIETANNSNYSLRNYKSPAPNWDQGSFYLPTSCPCTKIDQSELIFYENSSIDLLVPPLNLNSKYIALADLEINELILNNARTEIIVLDNLKINKITGEGELILYSKKGIIVAPHYNCNSKIKIVQIQNDKLSGCSFSLDPKFWRTSYLATNPEIQLNKK